MVKGVFDELARLAPKNHFTIGINDDVSHTSLVYDSEFSTEIPKPCALSSTASAPTALWAPTRTPSRSSAAKRRITRRAISSTTPRSPGP